MAGDSNDPEIYIGDPVSHASDRAVLEHVTDRLRGQPATILANINLSGRQIDLVVALGDLVLVIEAKAYNVPVRGGENGYWQVRLATGEWKNIPNLYVQTLGVRHALRDAMTAFPGGDVTYPAAALVFCPALPTGSSVPSSDRKAAIIALEGLDLLLRGAKRGTGWCRDRWRVFANRHRLIHVDDAAKAISPRLLAAGLLVRSYNAAFRETYGGTAEQLVHYPCFEDHQVLSSEIIVRRGANAENLLLQGPSGCGKSMTGYAICTAATQANRVPIVLSCKDYSGRIGDIISAEVTLLGAPSTTALLQACRALGCPILFLADGYNECVPSEQARLTRSLAALVRRYEASLVVTAQAAPERLELLKLAQIGVPPPTDETKIAIAEKAANGMPLRSMMTPVLASVRTGLEARLVSELGDEIRPEASRYGVFDAYVRKRLGNSAANGIQALTRIAKAFDDRLSISFSIRDFDRLVEREGLDTELVALLHRANFLVKRGERVSFGHELFLNAFAAEAAVRNVSGAEDIVAAIHAPRHGGRTSLIVGAIDDVSLRDAVLSKVIDQQILRACLSGDCGAYARAWAARRCDDVMRLVHAEIGQVSFEICGRDGHPAVSLNESSILPWSAQEKAFLHVCGDPEPSGGRLNTVLAAIATMDRRLAQEFTRLRTEAMAKKVPLRSGMFEQVYVHQYGVGLATICHAMTNRDWRSPASRADGELVSRLSDPDLSHGQVYLLLNMFRNAPSRHETIASVLPDLIRRYWRYSPYHLRLDLMMAAHLCGRATDTERAALLQALDELPPIEHPFLSTAFIDALKALGALERDENEHIAVVRGQIRQVLSDLDNHDQQELAASIWFSQFDHPYDFAYYEAISELSDYDKKALLFMVAKGARPDSFLVSVLMTELAAYGDSSAGPIISRWLELPPVRCVMPQEAIKNFVIAHIALARLGCPLPPRLDVPSDSAHALVACGEILYWLNRNDLASDRRHEECAAGLAVLGRHDRGVSANVLRELSHSYFEEGLSQLPGAEKVVTSIHEYFPNAISDICRNSLKRADCQRGYFEYFDSMETLEFAVLMLGECGDVADIPLLREISNFPRLGSHAIGAIRKLEKVFMPDGEQVHP